MHSGSLVFCPSPPHQATISVHIPPMSDATATTLALRLDVCSLLCPQPGCRWEQHVLVQGDLARSPMQKPADTDSSMIPATIDKNSTNMANWLSRTAYTFHMREADSHVGTGPSSHHSDAFSLVARHLCLLCRRPLVYIQRCSQSLV